MTAEADQEIKERCLYYQDLQSRMGCLHQKLKDHHKRLASLPPIIKPVVTFFDSFRNSEGVNRLFCSYQKNLHL